MSTYTNPEHPERIYKDCCCCGDLFEPVGYEGIKNAYCGTCESELSHGEDGWQDGIHWFWDTVKGEWVIAAELTEIEEDEGFEDCYECGYTHHHEDKCPNEETAKHYERWLKEDEKE